MNNDNTSRIGWQLATVEAAEQAASILLQATPPGTEVILFGSVARGEATSQSDVDLLVIEPQLRGGPDGGRRPETTRLRDLLRPMRLPVTLIVVSRAGFDAWKDSPNNVLNEAARKGRRLGHAA